MASARMRRVPRSDLAEPFTAALSDEPVGVIEGGPGYGRSSLLTDVLAAWPHQAAGWPPAGGARVLRALLRARATPCLVHVDDADALPFADRMGLAALAAELPRQHRLVLATSGRCPVLRQLAADLPGPRLAPSALLLSPEDVARRLWGAVADAENLARMAHTAAGGWAEGVQAAVAVGAAMGAAAEEAGAAPAALVTDRVETLAPEHAEAFARALSLPRMREPLLRVLAPDADLVGLLLAARVPLARQQEDVWTLPWPLARFLPRRPLDRDQADQAALMAQEAGWPAEGFVLLWDGGHADVALAMMEHAGGREAEALLGGWRRAPAVEAVHLRETPVAAERVLLAAERAGYADSRPFWRQAQARWQAAGQQLDPRVDLHVARQMLQRGRDARARAAATAILHDASSPELRAGALEILGRAARRRGTAHLDEAEHLLKEALALWRRAEEPGRMAEVRLHLSWVDRDRARPARALQRARSVGAAAPPAGPLWAQAALVQADLLCDTGSCDEAVALLARIEADCADWAGPRIRARLVILRARAALHREAWTDAAIWARQAAAAASGWLDGVHGTRTVAALAEIWSRLGETGRAESCVRLLASLPATSGLALRMASEGVAARVGDPATALEGLRRLLADPRVPPWERWRVMLLAALAATRAGSTDGPALATGALALAAQVGLPHAPIVREREVVRELVRAGGAVVEDAG